MSIELGTTTFVDADNMPSAVLPVSMSTWVFAADVTSKMPFQYAVAGSGVNRYQLFINASDEIQANHHDGNNATSVSTTTLSNSTWTHIGGLFLSRFSRTVVINGILENTNSDTQLDISGLLDTLRYGATGNEGNYLIGRLEHSAVWNAALDAQEWAALAAGYSPLLIRPDKLISYRPFVRVGDDPIVGDGVNSTLSPSSNITSCDAKAIAPPTPLNVYPVNR